MTCAKGKTTTLAAAAALLMSSAAAANAQAVIVTATRLPAPLSTTPDAYVITGADIAARQAVFAADVLRTAPGVVVTAAGPFGGVTGVSIRGASTDKTLVLIDGIPVNDASQPAGGFDFGAVDLADVSRVEILTGPQGALWGSDAIGGVVAFTTAEPTGVSAGVEGGSFGTWRLSAAAGASTPRWALGATASSFDTSGVSAADVRNTYTAFGAPNLHNSEADGLHAVTLGLRDRVELSDAIGLDGQARFNRSVSNIDGFPAPDFLFSDTNDVAVSESAEAFARARIAGPWGLKNEVSIGAYRIERGDHGESGPFGFTADREVYRWTVAKGSAADPVSFIAGAEHEASRATLSTGARFGLGASSVFAVAQGRPARRLTLVGSLRYDAPDRFRAQTTARAAATFDLGAGFSLQGSFNQGFKTPTISETACDFCFAPPVPLRPEHAQGYDAGLAWRSADGRLSLRATAYALDVTDQIAYVDLRYINIARAGSRGVEVAGDATLGAGFRIEAAYGYTDAVDATTGRRLLRVPLNAGSFSLFWTHGRADAALTVHGEDDDADSGLDGFTPVVRPGFVVADLAGGYTLNDHIRLTARINNLAGAHYQEVFGFGEPGRAVYLGVRLRQ